MALADDRGIDALSMRKLAQELGVEAMSLYNHVASRDDIVDGMIELAATEIDLAPDDGDWRSATRRRTTSAHEVLSRHHWAAARWMSSGTFGVARMRFADAVLRGLREAGFSDELTYHAFHVIQSHILGYTLYLSSFRLEGELKDLAADVLKEFPVDDYPDLALHIRQHLEPHEAHQGTFEFGLELILDGLERLRDA
jgi:AcrR family transcriptional regulator